MQRAVYIPEYAFISVGRYAGFYQHTCLKSYVLNHINRYRLKYLFTSILFHLSILVLMYLRCYLH